jgi:murein DD-endopeptidase MepM/ murein hydrolase activator NlpD
MEVKNEKMKKLFNDKKLFRKRILEFLDKKGFYIVLILCIAIVGATAVFVTTRNVTSSNENYDMDSIIVDELDEDTAQYDLETNMDVHNDEEVSIGTSLSTTKEDTEETGIVQTGNEDADPGKADEVNKENKENKKEEAEKPESKQEEKSQPKNENPPAKEEEEVSVNVADTGYKLVLPVIGDVSFDYAMDRLVYSKTLEDWRTHSGIDLAADRGTNVKAAADGFISEVKNDPRFGITVIIDHQNGLKTVYANLASDEVVVPNQKVKEGDVIGAIGNTALFESAEQPHLHFEVLMDNRPVDPKEYLPLK